MGFCSKFHMLSSSAKIFKIGQDLTKIQIIKRWELFESQCTCRISLHWTLKGRNVEALMLAVTVHTAESHISN